MTADNDGQMLLALSHFVCAQQIRGSGLTASVSAVVNGNCHRVAQNTTNL
jgi:hypothetical protein